MKYVAVRPPENDEEAPPVWVKFWTFRLLEVALVAVSAAMIALGAINCERIPSVVEVALLDVATPKVVPPKRSTKIAVVVLLPVVVATTNRLPLVLRSPITAKRAYGELVPMPRNLLVLSKKKFAASPANAVPFANCTAPVPP